VVSHLKGSLLASRLLLTLGRAETSYPPAVAPHARKESAKKRPAAAKQIIYTGVQFDTVAVCAAGRIKLTKSEPPNEMPPARALLS